MDAAAGDLQVSGSCTPHSPHQYRKIVPLDGPGDHQGRSGREGADRRARSRRLRSCARATRQMRPLEFLRAFGCVDKRFRPIRTGECKNFKPATGYGFAYHPHGILKSPNPAQRPPRRRPDRPSLSRVTSTLDKLTAKKRLKTTDPSLGGKFGLYLTEYGYQTNPPDKILGVQPSLQSTWLQQAAYIAANNPRVRNLTQYVWVDEKLSGGSSGWQSGLQVTSDGRPKLALRTFPIPFWAQRGGSGVKIWRPGAAWRCLGRADPAPRRARRGRRSRRCRRTRAATTPTTLSITALPATLPGRHRGGHHVRARGLRQVAAGLSRSRARSAARAAAR